MKPLLLEDLTLNNDGNICKSKIQKIISSIIRDYVSEGYSIKDMHYILMQIMNDEFKTMYNELPLLFNRTQTSDKIELQRISKEDSTWEKSQPLYIFVDSIGISNTGKRLVEIVENYKPSTPYGSIVISGKKYWYMFTNMLDS